MQRAGPKAVTAGINTFFRVGGVVLGILRSADPGSRALDQRWMKDRPRRGTGAPNANSGTATTGDRTSDEVFGRAAQEPGLHGTLGNLPRFGLHASPRKPCGLPALLRSCSRGGGVASQFLDALWPSRSALKELFSSAASRLKLEHLRHRKPFSSQGFRGHHGIPRGSCAGLPARTGEQRYQISRALFWPTAPMQGIGAKASVRKLPTRGPVLAEVGVGRDGEIAHHVGTCHTPIA
jgi:hypothetical protein